MALYCKCIIIFTIKKDFSKINSFCFEIFIDIQSFEKYYAVIFDIH